MPPYSAPADTMILSTSHFRAYIALTVARPTRGGLALRGCPTRCCRRCCRWRPRRPENDLAEGQIRPLTWGFVEPRGLEPLTPCLQSDGSAVGEAFPRSRSTALMQVSASTSGVVAASRCCRSTTSPRPCTPYCGVKSEGRRFDPAQGSGYELDSASATEVRLSTVPRRPGRPSSTAGPGLARRSFHDVERVLGTWRCCSQTVMRRSPTLTGCATRPRAPAKSFGRPMTCRFVGV